MKKSINKKFLLIGTPIVILALVGLISIGLIAFFLFTYSGGGLTTELKEIHDTDVEITHLFNTYDSDYDAYLNLQSNAKSKEDMKTVISYEQKVKLSAQKTSDAIGELLDKISEAQRNDLDELQQAYLDKLKLTSENYKLVVDTRIEEMNKAKTWNEYWYHNNVAGEPLVEILRADVRIAVFKVRNDWKSVLNETEQMKKLLDTLSSEMSQMRQVIPFKFLDEYDKFITLSRDYVDALSKVATRKVVGESVSDSEINAAFKKGTDAGALLIYDKGANAVYVKGELDEIEQYRRENFDPLIGKVTEALKKAQAYEGETNAKYEELVYY